MRRSNAAVDWTNVAVCAGLGLLLGALSARPAAAQGKLWAAVAISPSTLISGGSHAEPSQAEAERVALQSCQEGGHNDCRIVGSISGGCVALAGPANPVPNHYGFGRAATREGAATVALAECTKGGGLDCGARMTPCSGDDLRWDSPLPLPPVAQLGPVDPALVGFWKLNVSSGIWVWQITAGGAYTFRSEATDGTPPHAGQFTASNGHYTLHSISMVWDDQGTYTLPSSGVMVGVGKLGKGTWYRIAADPGHGEPGSEPATSR
jgi:hypothetical protein